MPSTHNSSLNPPAGAPLPLPFPARLESQIKTRGKNNKNKTQQTHKQDRQKILAAADTSGALCWARVLCGGETRKGKRPSAGTSREPEFGKLRPPCLPRSPAAAAPAGPEPRSPGAPGRRCPAVPRTHLPRREASALPRQGLPAGRATPQDIGSAEERTNKHGKPQLWHSAEAGTGEGEREEQSGGERRRPPLRQVEPMRAAAPPAPAAPRAPARPRQPCPALPCRVLPCPARPPPSPRPHTQTRKHTRIPAHLPARSPRVPRGNPAPSLPGPSSLPPFPPPAPSPPSNTLFMFPARVHVPRSPCPFPIGTSPSLVLGEAGCADVG
ncbi:vegetative cell wall protein gp1-like [Motacilla alba alba]|uniref:vegetative cell wall protein gp1-like n=1 Tax=Motacilla alba alba TaxID=1094192 RepID=UPI0018D5263D|nr:vegetative cell wall protein gp1-like [Motacilla alba alba]